MVRTSDTPPNDVPPVQAVQRYLASRADDGLSSTTLRSHEYRLDPFVAWCQDNDIESMGDLDGTYLFEYRQWRRADGDLNSVSLHTQLSTLRVFLKFCENLEAVRQNLHETVMLPDLDEGVSRDTILEADHAEAICRHLSRYHYASFDHVLILVLWRTGMRIGAARSLDVDDVDLAEQRLFVEHRPESETPLKLGETGRRVVAINDEVTHVLGDYIDDVRYPVTDEHGREPLLATDQGRATPSTLRRHVYKLTQPCHRTGECPHDRDLETCPAKGYTSTSGCPSSVSPHDIRRGAITHWRSRDVPRGVVSERMNVSERILEKHYDRRDETTKAEQRRRHIEDV